MVMKIKAAYLGLWLLASADAAQFTQSFLEYSATEEKRGSVFDDVKETFAASYGARRLTHTLPPFIVPRECNYSALNHTPTSTNPIDQMVCPDRCGANQDFTLRIVTTCDKVYTAQDAVCSSVITCQVDGCTNGAIACPPVELLDLNTALEEVCNVLCDAPVPPPVAPPVAASVAPPVAPPVPGTPVVAPVVAPNAVPGPVPTPVFAPVAVPTPVTGPVFVPTPVTGPVFVPTPVTGPVFVPTPVTGPVVVPTPVTGPVFVPTPGVAPVVAPVPAPTQDLANCYSDTTLLLQDVVNANPAVVTTFSLCSNREYNIGTLLNTAEGTTLTGGMAPLTARTNVHYICGATGEVSNNCRITGGEVQVISSFSLYQAAVTNCRFQGFTFSAALQAGAALDNSGDITFQDCVFEQHSNAGAMLLTWDPTVISAEPPINIGGGLTSTASLNGGLRKLGPTDRVQQVMNSMGVAVESLRHDNIEDQHGRGLWVKNLGEQSSGWLPVLPPVQNTRRQQEFVNENHSIPPSMTPPGCAYSFQHTDAVFMDEIFCPGWCGVGRDFTYTVTTVCSGNDCETFTDCRVKGCNDACGQMVNDCACASQGFDSIFENVCQDVCTATGPVAPPVLPPIAGPLPTPALPTPALPTPALPTPALPTPALPTPALPTPALPTPALPTPALPTPALPTPALPTPALPTPALPTPALPTPALPTPALPTPALPTPALPTPALPTPALPTVVTPTAPGLPTVSPLPRQSVFLFETTFRNNVQGFPLTDTARGVITTASGYNDVFVDYCNFQTNTFSEEGFGYAILAVEGSGVEITNTNFVGNNFAGAGTVVVLDGGSVSAMNNYGTFDDGLPCQFIAASQGSTSEAQCIEYDRSTEVPPPTSAPVLVPVTPSMAPVSGKRDSQPVRESQPQPVPESQPVQENQTVRESSPVRDHDSNPNRNKDNPSNRSRGNTSAKKSKKSKKSKSSTYCDDGSGKNGKRCLKRKST